MPASEKRQGTKSRDGERLLWGFEGGDADSGVGVLRNEQTLFGFEAFVRG